MIKELTNIKPVVNKDKNQILGSVIYIDNYGNLITSIKESLFDEVGKSRNFTIFARSVKFKKIRTRSQHCPSIAKDSIELHSNVLAESKKDHRFQPNQQNVTAHVQSSWPYYPIH